jgi:hypothetical protein
MRASTRTIHEHVALLGRNLGFAPTQEVADSILKLRLDRAYQPRIDLMWSLPLDEAKRKALAWALGRDTSDITHLPVVGIEVEGTTPTTKTMAADAANLAALGAPLGLLVVSEDGERNIYRRAARAIRTVRRSFGDIRVIPLEAGWLRGLIERRWPSALSALPAQVSRAPSGGESLKWSAETRRVLRRMGEDAGFVVAEPYTPGVLDATYQWAKLHRTHGLRHTTDPMSGTRTVMSRFDDYLTECEIDLAWLMPLPSALTNFLAAIDELDPCHREHGLCFCELWTNCAVVAFELESSRGKHAGGGLLNLAAYGVLGLVVTPSQAIADDLAATLRTYQPTLGLRNVFVRVMS